MNWRKPIIELLLRLDRSRILEKVQEIAHVSSLPAADISRYQIDRLKNILIHCHRNIPYYIDLLEDYGVVRNGRVFIENFGNLPFLDKTKIRNNFSRLKSMDLDSCTWYLNSSGGSSGEPISFIQDKEYLNWNIANKLFIKFVGGQTIGAKELRLWGSERDILEGRENLATKVRNWLYNRSELNTFCVSPEDNKHFVSIWNRCQPQWVEAYVQSVYEFADFLEKSGFQVWSPRGIVTSAGTLYPEVKRKVEAVFGCPVYNRYGSREVGDMACSCSAGDSLHLSPWNHFVEILDDNLQPVAAGEMGTVYVTGLTNYSMPLIRYRIGDIAVVSNKKSCHCGNNSPLLEKVVGREVHIFKTREGKKIDGEYFTHLFYYHDSIKRFQIVQKDYDLIKMFIVGSLKEKEKSSIEENIKFVMGSCCTISWEFVERIDNLKSGKFLYTISEI